MTLSEAVACGRRAERCGELHHSPLQRAASSCKDFGERCSSRRGLGWRSSFRTRRPVRLQVRPTGIPRLLFPSQTPLIVRTGFVTAVVTAVPSPWLPRRW